VANSPPQRTYSNHPEEYIIFKMCDIFSTVTHSSIYLVQFSIQITVHLTLGFCGPQPKKTTVSGVILPLHRFMLVTRNLPFPSLFILTSCNLHAALYKYSLIFLSSTALLQFIVL
jgi:hypothetical protein